MYGFMRGPQLGELLGQSAQAAFDELERLDPDTLLSENIDVLVHGLLARHLPEPVSVDWTAASGTPLQEKTIERTSMDFGERRTYRLPGSRMAVSWPPTGTAEILRRQASISTLAPDRGTRMSECSCSSSRPCCSLSSPTARPSTRSRTWSWTGVMPSSVAAIANDSLTSTQARCKHSIVETVEQLTSCAPVVLEYEHQLFGELLARRGAPGGGNCNREWVLWGRRRMVQRRRNCCARSTFNLLIGK